MAEVAFHPTKNCNNRRKTTKSNWSQDEDEKIIQIFKNNHKISLENIAEAFPGRNPQQLSDRWNKVLNPNIKRGSWKPEEDKTIFDWVQEHGADEWSALAKKLPGRIGKQCRERWINVLDPNIKRGQWTEDEDNLLIQLQEELGNKWSDIGKRLGRTDNCVKNHWNNTLKKRIERRLRGESEVKQRGRKPKCRTEQNSNENKITIDELPKPDEKVIDIANQIIETPFCDDLLCSTEYSLFSQTESPCYKDDDTDSYKVWSFCLNSM